MSNDITKERLQDIERVMGDPVLWAQVFIVTWDSNLKKETPWTARWYQADILRDKSLKKVARCGRRTGKTETMCIDMLHKVCTKQNFVCLVATPYENQIRLIFTRLNELVASSPLINQMKVKSTQNPFCLGFSNNSRIIGFTTGANSGNGAASIRGQKCDALYLDEMDYMADADFDTIATIAAERADISVFMSSTPTGARKKFYECCMDKTLGYTEFHIPSTMNPNWCPAMEAEFRSQLSDSGYVHEILAEFGTEDAGVFNKEDLDIATQKEWYAYNPLDYIQKQRCIKEGLSPTMHLYDINNRAPFNLYRCVGIDFDKYQASSSILVLDYLVDSNMFKIIKRVELPKAEYSYDNAFNKIVEINKIYNPSWIYCDRGEGEYILERLNIYGNEHPETGLHLKVKGFRFSQNVQVYDPASKEIVDKPIKPFMVNQLSITFERHNMIMSPFDELLHKQLVDYSIERIGRNGPVFNSKDEHFVDALGLAHLAFVLEFADVIGNIRSVENSSKVAITRNTVNIEGINKLFSSIKNPYASNNINSNRKDDDDLPGDKPPNFVVHHGTSLNFKIQKSKDWGSRNILRSGNTIRRMW